MLKTYTVRFESSLIEKIDTFIKSANDERLYQFKSGNFEAANQLPYYVSRSDLIERALCEYLMRYERG